MTIRPQTFLLAALACVSAPVMIVHAQPAPNKPNIVFDNQVLDLGKLLVGSRTEGSFTFKNTGEQPLVITKVSSDCMCVSTFEAGEPLERFEPGFIRFTIRPVSTPGPFSDTLRVTSNAANQPRVMLKIKATIVSPPRKPGG